MNLTKQLLATILLIASASSHSTIIEYNGYSRESTSNVVRNDNQAWLMWDATSGKSTDWFLNSPGSKSLKDQGWRLANFDDINGLFTDFTSPRYTFAASPSNDENLTLLWSKYTLPPLYYFSVLFLNNTLPMDTTQFDGGEVTLYIDDTLAECNGKSPSSIEPECRYGLMRINSSRITTLEEIPNMGLVLVKVPEPTPIALLFLGTVGLLSRRIKLKSQHQFLTQKLSFN